MKVEKMFIKPTKSALFLPFSFLLNRNFAPVRAQHTMHLSCLWQEACHLLENYEIKNQTFLGKGLFQFLYSVGETEK